MKVFKSTFSTALFAIMTYENGLTTFTPFIHELKIGSRIYSGSEVKSFKLYNGCSSDLKNMKLFSTINNIELFPFSGSILCRAAGAGATLISRNRNIAVIKLKSG